MSTVATPHTDRQGLGYKTHSIGGFRFERDEYFAHIFYPGGRHIMPIDAFLRALMRDVAWGFFYGTVNFDNVFGTVNHYGTVEMFIGLFNEAYRSSNRHHVETFESKDLKKVFEEMLETGSTKASTRSPRPTRPARCSAPRRAATQGDHAPAPRRQPHGRPAGRPRLPHRERPLNRQFNDMPTDQPEVHAEPGFENEVHAFNFFDYVSRSDVTWNPSVVSCVKDSQFCATTEEHILPITHGNDRVEWFIQASDEIIWDVDDRATGKPRAKVIMKAGDVAAMPADIRHRGYSPKRSILIVWENNDATLPQRTRRGKLTPYPVEF